MIALAGAGAMAHACAQRTYQLPPDAPQILAADRPDGGNPPTQPPSRRGIIVPGDPSSGTTRLGTQSTELETHTGTSGTRVQPGSSDGR